MHLFTFFYYTLTRSYGPYAPSKQFHLANDEAFSNAESTVWLLGQRHYQKKQNVAHVTIVDYINFLSEYTYDYIVNHLQPIKT